MLIVFFIHQSCLLNEILSFFICRMMWAAGSLAAMSSLAYPAISAMVSCNADPDQQGMVPCVGHPNQIYMHTLSQMYMSLMKRRKHFNKM